MNLFSLEKSVVDVFNLLPTDTVYCGLNTLGSSLFTLVTKYFALLYMADILG